MKDQDIIRKVEAFRSGAAALTAQRSNRAFTLIHAATGIPIARLRPIPGQDDLFDLLYWSPRKERWAPFGPFGPTAASLDQALRIIAEASIFWLFFESQV